MAPLLCATTNCVSSSDQKGVVMQVSVSGKERCSRRSLIGQCRWHDWEERKRFPSKALHSAMRPPGLSFGEAGLLPGPVTGRRKFVWTESPE